MNFDLRYLCRRLLLSHVLLLLMIALTHAEVFNGYEIWDLDSNNAYFPIQAASWNISNRASSANATQCASNWILGGYQIVDMHGSFSKTYINLPAHTAIQFTMYFWIIDCQEQTNLFQIYFDSQLLGTWDSNAYASSSNQYPSICAGSYQDFPNIPVDGSVPHSSNSLTFEVLSMYSSSSSTFSFGFRDIHLLFVNTTSPSLTACQFRLPSSSSSQPSCLCGTSQYNLAGSSSCSSCASSCQQCLGPSTSDCTQCVAGYSFINNACVKCDSTCAECYGTTASTCVRCSTSGDYLFYNDTCQANCPAPLVSRSFKNVSHCVSPCSSNQYLYQNGSCLDSCSAPFVQFVQSTTKFCNTPCPESQYLYWNGSCSSSCPTSFCGMNNTIAVCNFYCSQVHYLYWNNTCLESCNNPLVGTSTSDQYKRCSKPCDNGDYVLPNGTCIDYCHYSTQTTSDGVLICPVSCGSDEYSYWNGSCLSSCDSPLNKTFDSASGAYCNKPCPDGTYLFSNGSCSNSCQFVNKTTDDGVLECLDPCQQDEYLYSNQSCLSSCNSPYKVTSSSDGKLCNPPCPENQYYDENDGTCLNKCNPPLVIQQNGDYKTCKNGAIVSNMTISSTSGGSNQTQSSDSDGPSSSDNSGNNPNVHSVTNLVTQAAVQLGVATNFLRTNNTNSVFMVALAKLIKYVKYIDLDFPDYVQQAFGNSDVHAFSITTLFTIPMPNMIKSSLPERAVPSVFEAQGVHSSYLANQWSSLSALLVFFLAGVFFGLVEAILKRSDRMKILLIVISRLRVITKWNLLLLLFFNSYDDLVLYAIIEFRTLHLDSFVAYLSFFVCLAMTLVAVYVLVRVFIISKARVKRIQEVKMAPTVHKNKADMMFNKKWEPHQVVYIGFEDDGLLKQLCLLILTCQPILSYLVIGLLYKFPLVQTVFLTVITMLIIAYLLVEKPMRDRFHFFVAMIYELLCLVVNICLLMLAVIQDKQAQVQSLKAGAYEAILFCNMFASLASYIFLWSYVFLAVKTAYKASVGKGLKEKMVWLNVIIAPYQNPGMDLDYMNDESSTAIISPKQTEGTDRQKLQHHGGIDRKKRSNMIRRSIFPELNPISDDEELDVSNKSPTDKITSIFSENSLSGSNNNNLLQEQLIKRQSNQKRLSSVSVKDTEQDKEEIEVPVISIHKAPENPFSFDENLILNRKRYRISTNSPRLSSLIININKDTEEFTGEESYGLPSNHENKQNKQKNSLIYTFKPPQAYSLRKRTSSENPIRIDVLKRSSLMVTTSSFKPSDFTQKNSFSSASDEENQNQSEGELQTGSETNMLNTNEGTQILTYGLQPNTRGAMRKFSSLRNSRRNSVNPSVGLVDQKAETDDKDVINYDVNVLAEGSNLNDEKEDENTPSRSDSSNTPERSEVISIKLSDVIEDDRKMQIKQGSLMTSYFG